MALASPTKECFSNFSSTYLAPSAAFDAIVGTVSTYEVQNSTDLDLDLEGVIFYAVSISDWRLGALPHHRESNVTLPLCRYVPKFRGPPLETRCERPNELVFTARHNGPFVPGGKAACSRRHNFHFDRPAAPEIGCYLLALGCALLAGGNPGAVNPTKQSASRADACGERRALRALFRGPSSTLQA